MEETDRVFIAHRRLAIIDIETGQQPMWNEDGQVGVVFNGEIYNHAELRRDLQARGHKFRSDHSDTEVLVHGYEEWGNDLPERLNGMFAFCVYDRTRRRLFIARDRFGEKPLYYTNVGGLFAFASELSSLAAHSRIEPTLSSKALQKLFAYGYIPAPYALFENVWKLPGGHHLTFDVTEGTTKVQSYWAFRVEPDERLGVAHEDGLVDELSHLLSESVRRRLISDVPLGVFLSGGIDSSAIVALAAQHRPPETIKTFTIGFNEPSFDESANARALARHVGTNHQERFLDLETAQQLVPSVLGRMDEPIGDPSILPTYLLCEFAREQVTVALSGDGGDELFAGYDPFKALEPARIYSAMVPNSIHRGMRRLADLIPISTRNMGLDFKVRRALTGLSYPSSVWNPVWMAPVEPTLMRELFEAPLRFEEVYEEAIQLWDENPKKDLIDRSLEFFTNLYLQSDILTKVDRAGMLVSLESRAVFLDNDLVDFARRLPNRFKFRNGQQKYLLKKAMARFLPDDVLSRPKKGFGLPTAKWLRTMMPSRDVDIDGVRTSTLYRWWREHRDGQGDHRLALWTHLALLEFLAGRSSGDAKRHVA